MKKRALLYGNQKSFSKFLKYKFQDVLIFDVCRDFKNINTQLNDYSVIVYVIYIEEDLVDFFKLYGKQTPLIVCVFNKRVLDVLIDLDDLFLLDTSMIRSEMFNQLGFYIKESILNIPLGQAVVYKPLNNKC